MRFVLIVEGEAEKLFIAAFLKKWLDQNIDPKVRVDVRNLRGYGEFSRKIVATAREYLDGPRREQVIGVIGLLDLYGPSFYPANITAAEQRFAWGKKHFEELVGRPDFRMFFAVHELEAWLVAQPALLPKAVQDDLPPQAKQPETVNFDQPPAKLLARLYRKHCRREYHKLRDGSKLFGRLEPASVRDKCPRFREMLDTLLMMAKAKQI